MAGAVNPVQVCPNGYTGPWVAPAKLNLMLNIVGRRADGYHQLQTVFQLLDFGDCLYLRPRTDGVIRQRSSLPGVSASADLCVRAAQLLREVSGQAALGVDIRLDKRIPRGGGLGGGSSDAASVLRVLNQLWGLHYENALLAELGLRLGADVPVFVQGFSAWGEGIGEQLTPLTLPAVWYLIITPDCAVATATIFHDPELTRAAPHRTISEFFAGMDVNLCTPVVRKRYPKVAHALDWLSTYGAARLTGTGASVFAAFTSAAAARAAQAQVPPHWRSYVAQGVDRSGLSAQLTLWAAQT